MMKIMALAKKHGLTRNAQYYRHQLCLLLKFKSKAFLHFSRFDYVLLFL